LELDTSGKPRRTSKLLVVDGEGQPVTSRAQALAEAERLEKETEARAERIRRGLPEPLPPAPAIEPLTVDQLCDRFLRDYSRRRIKDLVSYRIFARTIM